MIAVTTQSHIDWSDRFSVLAIELREKYTLFVMSIIQKIDCFEIVLTMTGARKKQNR